LILAAAQSATAQSPSVTAVGSTPQPPTCAKQPSRPDHYVVVTEPRVYIHSTYPAACARQSAETCKASAYVIAGDVLNQGADCQYWVYATFEGDKRTTSGWVSAASVATARPIDSLSEGGMIDCDRDRGRVTIHPTGAAELKAQDTREHRCRLPGGFDVLIRWGHDDLWGKGSDEQYFTRMSIWVNGAKWIDRAIIGDTDWDFSNGPTDHELMVSAEISADGMTTCNNWHSVSPYETTSGLSPEKSRCSHTSRPLLPTSPDPVEFPARGTQRLPAYTTHIVESRDEALCSAALAPPGSASAVVTPMEATSLIDAISPEMPNGLMYGEQVLSFDVDNSGNSQLVIHHEESSHASMSDTYFVYTEAALNQLVTHSLPRPEDLQAHAAFTYPYDWEVCVSGGRVRRASGSQKSCATNEELLMPFSMVNVDHKEIRFRDQYMSMKPFRYHGATYFVLESADADRRNVAFIVKPLPKGHVELTCSLESISPHF
jgi:hypothetical protein